MKPEADGGALHRLLRRAIDVRADEVRAVVVSFVYFYFALGSWFVLRPMRDTVAASSGATQLSWLWVGTLSTMLVANAAFSALAVRVAPRKIVPYAYHGIALSLVVFYGAFQAFGSVEGSAADIWLGRAFYIWTSVFNLFVASLFWSFMADGFRSDQAKRLFGFIGVGGTLGSITGSAATAELTSWLGPANLLLVSCILLEIAVLAAMRFPHSSSGVALPPAGDPDARPGVARANDSQRGTALGGSVWAGFSHTVKSPYLFGVAIFLMLFTFGSSFLYFEQSAIVGRTFPDRTSRTVALAQIELAVQVLTVLVQVFFTGRIIRWFGMGVALAFLPVVSMVGFGALGMTSSYAAIAAFVIARRAGNFALTNPAMEVLFTVVPREDKYKAKSFIETFVYRLGDQAGAWTFAGLAAVGVSLTTTAWIAVPISLAWLGVALWLARRHNELARAATPRLGGDA